VESHQGWALRPVTRGLISPPVGHGSTAHLTLMGRNLRLMPNLNLDIFLTLTIIAHPCGFLATIDWCLPSLL